MKTVENFKHPASIFTALFGNPFKVFAFAMVATLCIFFTIEYVSQETPGYFWDYSVYPDQLNLLSAFIKDGRFQTFFGFLKTNLQHNEYNAAPVIPLLPIALAFGDARLTYILALVIFYLLPAVIVISILIRECWMDEMTEISLPLSVGFVALYPLFWATTLRGYIDMASLIPMGMAILMILRTKWLLHSSVKQNLLIGFLLWVTFLFRRHFAFSIVAIFIMTSIFALHVSFYSEENRRKLQLRLMRNLLLTGSGLAIPALLIQRPLVEKIWITSYVEIYSAYQAGFWEKIKNVYTDNGLFWVGLAISGFAYLLVRRNNKKILFCTCVGGLSFILFQTVQVPGIHHKVAFALCFAPVSSWPLYFISRRTQSLKRLS